MYQFGILTMFPHTKNKITITDQCKVMRNLIQITKKEK